MKSLCVWANLCYDPSHDEPADEKGGTVRDRISEESITEP